MPAAKMSPVGPSTTTRPPVMYSQQWSPTRSEEHTSELQSHLNLVCRLLLEKKNYTIPHFIHAATEKLPQVAHQRSTDHTTQTTTAYDVLHHVRHPDQTQHLQS